VDRTVSANLGLSFSIGNVCAEVGWDHVARWLTESVPRDDLRNAIRNKMIRPTTVPQTETAVQIEQAVAREALRLALAHHVSSCGRLRGVRPEGTAAARLGRVEESETLDWRRVGLVLGSGGPLAHAPRPEQAGAVLVDGLRPRGVTSLAVDAGFLLPHLGALARRDPEAARQVLFNDCLLPLGVVVAPLASVARAEGEDLLGYVLRPRTAGRESLRGTLRAGDLVRLELGPGESGRLDLHPVGRVDVGAGRGVPLQALVVGGATGVLLDGRAPDLGWPRPALDWRRDLVAWYERLGVRAEVRS
jgi:hypothetical protein